MTLAEEGRSSKKKSNSKNKNRNKKKTFGEEIDNVVNSSVVEHSKVAPASEADTENNTEEMNTVVSEPDDKEDEKVAETDIDHGKENSQVIDDSESLDELTKLKEMRISDESNATNTSGSTISNSRVTGTYSQDVELDLEEALIREKSYKQQIKTLEESNRKLDTLYRKLLNKIAQIKESVSERIKSDEEELKLAKDTIDALENEKKTMTDENAKLKIELESSEKEKKKALESCKLLESSVAKIKMRETSLEEQVQQMKGELSSWESISTEQRSAVTGLQYRIRELESEKLGYLKVIDDLRSTSQNHLAKIQAFEQQKEELTQAHTTKLQENELRYENSMEELTQKYNDLHSEHESLRSKCSQMDKEINDLKHVESQMNDKNLIIGKLRHEAVILNEHLIKATKIIKQGISDDVIDRQLITNLFLQFLSLSRSDTKRFEILQLISSCLEWNEEQRLIAGLVNPRREPGSGPSTPKFEASPSPTPLTTTRQKRLTDMIFELIEKEKKSDLGV